MNVLKSLLLTAAVALLATVASAAPKEKFTHTDVNKDKVLTRAEACAGSTPRLCARFFATDGNRDGVISRREFKADKKYAKRAAKGKPDRW